MDSLATARAAARAYAARIELPADQAQALLGPPLSGPVPLERDGTEVLTYRWLGGGRGDPYLQVELDLAGGTATVYGGAAHVDQPPATYAIGDLAVEG